MLHLGVLVSKRSKDNIRSRFFATTITTIGLSCDLKGPGNLDRSLAVNIPSLDRLTLESGACGLQKLMFKVMITGIQSRMYTL